MCRKSKINKAIMIKNCKIYIFMFGNTFHHTANTAVTKFETMAAKIFFLL